MFVKVKLINGFKQPLIYQIPSTLEREVSLHSLVKVPLQKRVEYAVVCEMLPTVSETYHIRELLEYQPIDATYSQFITKLSAYNAVESSLWYRRLRSFFETTHNESVPALTPPTSHNTHTLTTQQQAIVDDLKVKLDTDFFCQSLIYGVTGSGKTEIYKALIRQALEQKKTVIFMVPEVSLAVQFAKLFKKEFSCIYSFHSATSAQEKKGLWQQIINHLPVVIVGVHLPILLPIANLGLIIVDEEHDVGFQEKKFPRINSKEAALLRAQTSHLPIVLGSATPSLSSLYAVEQKKCAIYYLKERFAGAFPQVQVVSLLQKKPRKNFWITQELYKALQEQLIKKEQSIIFINRRGHSFFVQCGDCSYIFECTGCSVSLTLHDDGMLRCHYCSYQEPIPQRCRQCHAHEKSLLKKGIGTQQVVKIIQELFPLARIGRADLDSTINKKKWQATLNAFSNRELDILVGTQTITKGYHFPGVTLVGMLWADINLSIPCYNAAETTLQQIIQVAGRAGRQSQESKVIIQTMQDHDIFKFVNELDYEQFYHREIHYRKQLRYPPCFRLAEIELRNEQEELVERDANSISDFLIKTFSPAVIVLGPTAPPVHKINHIYIRKISLKASDMKTLLNAYHSLNQNNFSSSLCFTPSPLQ